MPNEQDEAFALSLISRGGGFHPLPEHKRFDEAYVAFHLEHPGHVTVYLRRDGGTKQAYSFCLTPAEPPDDELDETEDSPRDIANALAERFLCDTLVVLQEMPQAIRRGAMERALGRLKAGGKMEAGDAEVLDGFVKAWDRAAAP